MCPSIKNYRDSGLAIDKRERDYYFRYASFELYRPARAQDMRDQVTTNRNHSSHPSKDTSPQEPKLTDLLTDPTLHALLKSDNLPIERLHEVISSVQKRLDNTE